MARLEDDALTLVYWYESQPERITRKKDHEIAEALRWFVGGYQYQGRTGGNGRGPGGDVARVRRTRRHVDRDDSGLFADYSFGTRKSAGGTSWSYLSRKGEPTGASSDAAVAQLVTSEQRKERYVSELAREIVHYDDLYDEFMRGGEYVKAIAVHAAAADYRADGKLRQETVQLLAEAGLAV